MKLTDKIKAAFTQKQLGNSLGWVTRNYAKAPEFNPQKQVTGITYKAIDKAGQVMSTYEPQILKPNGDPYTNHPLLALFNNPNPRQTATDYVHLYTMLMDIYGETFWYLVRGERTNRIMEVYLLNPAQVELKVYDGELIGYVLHKNNGTHVPLLPEEVIHDKKPNPFNEWRGMSILEKSAVYIDTEINTAHFTLNYIKNSASPSGIVSLPDMTKEAFMKFTAQWREGYEGPENAGKTAFIRGNEAKFQAVGATLKDIDQKVTREMAKEDVLIMLDTPKEILGWTKESGFGRNTWEAAYFVYAESKIEPMMRRLDRIYEKIGESFGTLGKVNVTHESPVPEDKEFVLQQNKVGVNVWLTPNEVRNQYGLDPLPDGNILNPSNVVAASKAIKIVKKTAPTKAEVEKKLNDEQENFRSKLVDTNEIYAKKIKTVISRFANKQEAEVIGKINATSKAFDEWLFNIKEESVTLTAALTPIIIELMEAQSEDVAHFITGELLTITDEVRKTVDQNILQIAGVYNQDTIRALEKTLSEGQTAGESLAKLKKRVESVYTDAKGYRAERIARTESLKASNNTAELVYKQNGFTEVQWFTNPGACEFCRTYSGRTKTIGQNFNSIGDVITGDEGGQLRIEYANIPTPPLHPNCTCSLVPVK